MHIDPKDFGDMKFLGKGRYGTVMKVMNKKTGDIYALKIHPKVVAGFTPEDFYVREKRTLEKLPSHENIIKYYGFYENHEDAHFVLEYFDGFTLQRVISESKGLQPEKMVSKKEIKLYLIQIIEGIKHMHKNGVYHCDLKPENILISQNNVKIVDFGCSVINEKGVIMGREISFLGTPGFTPPEAADLTYTGKIYLKDLDIWAFGCSMYYAYTRIVPFVEGFSFDTLRNVRNIKVDFSILPKDVEKILKRIFIADSSIRYTVEELEEAIKELEE